MKKDKDLVKKALDNKMSFKDKIKAQLKTTQFIAKNRVTLMKLQILSNRLAKAKEKCPDCCKKINELAKPKYSDEEAYNKILNGYFCKDCTPHLKAYFDFRNKLNIKDIKL